MRSLIPIAAVVIVLCIVLYFHLGKARTVEDLELQDERLEELETGKKELFEMISSFSIDQETIRLQMDLLRQTNKDCRVCHSGGMSCKKCHPDFDGIITKHRERVE